MDITSTFNSGLQAIQRAENNLSRNAESIARTTAGLDETEDLNTALVNSKISELEAKAGTQIIKSATEITETLIDIKV